MAVIDFDTTGLTQGDIEDLLIIREDNTKEMQRLFRKAIAAALEEMGLAGERFAKQEAPVDTGRLRNSITHVIDTGEQAVYIGTNVEYAPYQEFGVRGRDGKHFLEHAANNHNDYYQRIFKKHMENA